MSTNTSFLNRKTLRKLMAFLLVCCLITPCMTAYASISVGVGDAVAGKGVGVSWGSVSGVDHYEYSVRDTTSNDLIYERKSTTGTSFSISKSYIIAGHSYKVWVGAIKADGAEPTGEYQGTATFSVPACAHKNTKEVKDTAHNSWCKVTKDKSKHETVYVYDIVCSDCGEIVQNDIIYDVTEDHNLNSKGVCKNCGYEEECTHSVTYESDRGQVGLGTSISDTQHIATRQIYVICSGCGETVEIIEREKTVKHSFDANGDCPECDYRTSCAHKNTELRETSRSYKGYNEDEHKIHIISGRFCTNAACGKETEHGIISEEYEAHKFSGNTCTKCGYTKAEKLSVSASRNQSSATTGDTIGASASAKGGSGKYGYSWSVSCDGSTVSSTDYGWGASYSYPATQAGSWSFTVYVQDKETGESVSASTGSVKVKEAPCLHTQKSDKFLYTECVKISDSSHELRTWYQAVCDKCGENRGEPFYKASTEAHAYDANGNCACGSAKPTEECQHASSYEQLIDTYLEQYDTNKHYVVSVYQDLCSNCHVVLNAKRETVSQAAHEYVNGVCACGAAQPSEDPCDHATAEELIDKRTEQNDENTHRLIAVYHVFCECGKVDKTEERVTLAPHMFNENGWCACGAIQPKTEVCDHTPAREYISERTEQNNERNHKLITKYHVFYACGAVDKTEETVVLAQHTFDANGQCACGYANTPQVCAVYGAAHQFDTIDHYEEDHPHKVFHRCACGHVLYTGAEQSGISGCCDCGNHIWGDAYENGGQWYRKCKNCPVVRTIDAPKTEEPTEEPVIPETKDERSLGITYSVALYSEEYSVVVITMSWNDISADYYTSTMYDVTAALYATKVTELGKATVCSYQVFSTHEYLFTVYAYFGQEVISESLSIYVGKPDGQKREYDIPYKTTRTEARSEMATFLDSMRIGNTELSDLYARACVYYHNGLITRDEAANYYAQLQNRLQFDTTFSASGEATQFLIGPDGSQVAQKVLSENILTEVGTIVTSAVFDSYTAALDPFFEEFGQTMDVMAKELRYDLGDNIFMQYKDMIDALKDTVGEDTIENAGMLKDMLVLLIKENKLDIKYQKDILAWETGDAEFMFDMWEKIEHLSNPDALLLKDLYTESITEQINDQSFTYELEEGIKEFIKKNITIKGKPLSDKQYEDFCKGFGTFTEVLSNSVDFLEHATSRLELDRDKTLEYCDMLDQMEDLTSELTVAKKLLRQEVSGNNLERMTAIVSEYLLKLAVDAVDGLATDAVDKSLQTNPYYLAYKGTVMASNALLGVKDIISNTRGMDAQYDNYDTLYKNYLTMKAASESDPGNSEKRENARIALQLCLSFNLSASEYYLGVVESGNKAVLTKLASLVSGNDDPRGVQELIDMIKKDVALKERLKEKFDDNSLSSVSTKSSSSLTATAKVARTYIKPLAVAKIRTGPGQAYDIIGHVNIGTLYEIVKTTVNPETGRTWYGISFEGRICYVAAAYVDVVQ